MKVLIILIISGGMLFGIEFGLGFMPYSRTEKIYSILKMDSSFLWKVKENYDDIFFEGKTKTNSAGYREVPGSICDGASPVVWIMGASPSFGWGVDNNKTYASLLAQEKGFCVRNFSSIGYSSAQGIKLFKELLKRERPDQVIVTYMVNDIDSLRFFFSGPNDDSVELEKKRDNSKISVMNFIRSLNLTRIAQRIASFFGKNSHYQFTRYWFENRRVTLKEYQKNLQQFAEICSRKNIKLLMVAPPVSFPARDMVCKDEQENDKKMEKVRLALNRKNYGEVLSLTSEVLRDCEYHFEASSLNIFSRLHLKKEIESDIAHLYQTAALFSGRIVVQYKDLMRIVAKNNHIRFIDMDQVFNKDSDLFCGDAKEDFVHPNERGHSFFFQQIKTYVK